MNENDRRPDKADNPEREVGRMEPGARTTTSDQLRDDIDSGRTGDKVDHPDPAAAPLGTDAEAGGNPPTQEELARADRDERGRAETTGMMAGGGRPGAAPAAATFPNQTTGTASGTTTPGSTTAGTTPSGTATGRSTTGEPEPVVDPRTPPSSPTANRQTRTVGIVVGVIALILLLVILF